MLKQLSVIELHKAVKDKVERNTGLSCYDAVPDNAPAPFYFVQTVGKRSENSKTMYCDIYTIWVHAIAKERKSSVGIYSLIQDLENALSEEVVLPDGFFLVRQMETGLQSLQTDETNEKHAILAYEFKICYGYQVK